MEKVYYNFTRLKFIQNNFILNKIYRVLKRDSYDNKKYNFFYKKHFYYFNNNSIINSYISNSNNTNINERNEFIYEKVNTNLFLKLIHNEQFYNFFDIGSAIGYFSILGCSNFQNVYSFECIDKVYALQKNYLELFQIPNVKIYNVAIGNNKSLTYSDFNGTFSGECITIDDFCEKNKIQYLDKSFFKIDIEGFEFEALKGMKKILAHKPKLLIEIHKTILNQNNENVLQVIEYLFQFYNSIDVILNKDSFEITKNNFQKSKKLKKIKDNIFIIHTTS